MTDPIEILREACNRTVSTYEQRQEALDALSEIKGNVLPELPEGWRYLGVNFRRECWEANICRISDDRIYFLGDGLTPRAACLAAIEKVKS